MRFVFSLRLYGNTAHAVYAHCAITHELWYNADVITLTCEICGKPFQVKPYRKKTARFCSFSCGGKWHMSIRKMPDEHKLGNKWRLGLRPTNAFTSEQAKTINTVRGKIYACAQCNIPFEIKPWVEKQNKSKSGLRFCSKSCRSNYIRENKSGDKSPLWVGGVTTYRGKGWEAARIKAIERDGGKCADCGIYIGRSIPVHHIVPFRLFSSAEEANALNNLICLCQKHHMRREASIKTVNGDSINSLQATPKV